VPKVTALGCAWIVAAGGAAHVVSGRSVVDVDDDVLVGAMVVDVDVLEVELLEELEDEELEDDELEDDDELDDDELDDDELDDDELDDDELEDDELDELLLLVAVVRMSTHQPPVMSTGAWVVSSTAHRFHVPFGLRVLNVARLVEFDGVGAGASQTSTGWASPTSASSSTGR
jgi:hypothetical protein